MANTATMTPERWQRLQALFDQALALEGQARADFIVSSCGNELALREQLLSLVMASSTEDSLFEQRVDQAIHATIKLDAELPAGFAIGSYRIVKLLGRGGMGAVYLAERADKEFQHQVAIKIVADGSVSNRVVARLRSERQILANLNHPNIARLLDGGATNDGKPYIAMEYVDGQRIDRYCEAKQLTLRARLLLFQQVCAAVQYAHQNLVVHRDLKPSNILVTEDGTPKLLDFGIAKLVDPNATTQGAGLTRVHERVLTPEFASPEQIRGEQVGTVSDVYALGVLLYELLAGVKPYNVNGLSFDKIEKLICNFTPPKPSAAVQADAKLDIPTTDGARAKALQGDLDTIVLKAMHKDTQRRYGSAAALAADIDSYLHNRPITARPDTFTYRAQKFWRRNRLALSSAAAVMLVVMGLIAFYTWRLTAERDTAERERLTATRVSDFMTEVFQVADPSESRGNSVTVREMLDAAVERIDTELKDEPRVRTTLLRTMGEVYDGLGLWNQAQKLLTEVVAEERKSSSQPTVDLARALNSLAGSHHQLNHFDVAEKLYSEAWAIRLRLHATADYEAATLLSSIAGSYRSQQRFDEALDYHRRSEEIARLIVPLDRQQLASVLQSQAMTQLLAGNSQQAEHTARESLDLLSAASVHETNKGYVNTVNTLAEALRRMYRYDEAEKLHRDVLQLQIKRLGPDSPMVARTLNNLSHVLRAKGDYAGAESALQRAIDINTTQLGEDSFDVATAYHNLGSLRHEAGMPASSMRALEKSLAIKRQLTGERSPHLVSTLLEEVGIQRDQGDLAAADRLLALAAEIADGAFKADDPRRVPLLLESGRLALARNDLPTAEQKIREALNRTDDKDTGRVAGIKSVLADVLLQKGEAKNAATLLRESLAIRKTIMPADHWMIAQNNNLLGAALSSNGDKDEGETLLKTSTAQLEKLRPADDPILRAAKQRLHDYGQ